MKIIVALLGVLMASSAVAETFRGHLYIGPENEAFYPCGNTQGYWFLTSDKVRDRLMTEGLQNTSAFSDQGVFVVLVGKVGRKTMASDGDYASTYPAFFHIQEIISISEVSESDCQR